MKRAELREIVRKTAMVLGVLITIVYMMALGYQFFTDRWIDHFWLAVIAYIIVVGECIYFAIDNKMHSSFGESPWPMNKYDVKDQKGSCLMGSTVAAAVGFIVAQINYAVMKSIFKPTTLAEIILASLGVFLLFGAVMALPALFSLYIKINELKLWLWEEEPPEPMKVVSRKKAKLKR